MIPEELIKETNLRVQKVQDAMKASSIDGVLLSSNVNLLYIFGSIYVGAAFIPCEGDVQFFIRRPNTYPSSNNIHYIRKIEDIVSMELIDTANIKSIALEIDELPYSEVVRQYKLFPEVKMENASSLMRLVRSIKTPREIEILRATVARHMKMYRLIPSLYKSGMTDRELQIEIERQMRLMGSVGVFRTFGPSMEIFMGSLIAGDNAEAPSPYDFAMGGEGSEALPLGSNNSPLKEGMAVMVDMAGNYSSYISDMTRTFSIGKLSSECYRLHDLSRKMHADIMMKSKPGTKCSDIYNVSMQAVKDAGAEDKFMGTKQQAAFVGHGLGLQINEMPVLTSRSKDILIPGMVIAYEPKFVIPHIGAVGVENTYLVTENGVEKLTGLEEDIIDLTL
ncbi:Xaa-Pro peptidase family protein [Porphyromonas pogonae]|uniref:M24 family metallopeptidase n=1 Tax=Porphyromonas pogonae TaxID=867595 RepID=UPI002E771549|nr:Xaa-Pro peptidase family protein [Porphyromonas pogonae]